MTESIYFKGTLELSRPLSSDECNHLQLKIHSGTPTEGKPDSYCGWRISRNLIEWDNSQGFQTYLPWLHYLIDHFFDRWSIALNGSIQWTGYKKGDCGVLSVRDSVIHIHYDSVEEE